MRSAKISKWPFIYVLIVLQRINEMCWVANLIVLVTHLFQRTIVAVLRLILHRGCQQLLDICVLSVRP